MSAIGHRGVFRLNGWSRQIHTEFQGFRVTWENAPQACAYTYGALTLYGAPFQGTSTSHTLSYCAPSRQTRQSAPTTPHTQPLPGITCMRFSLLRFRSPLLSESQLFSLPMGTEMFHFPTFPPHTLFHSGAGNRTQLRLGSPIRTPPDHSSVANSPGLIAGSYVLHRLSMPRHPPCALHSLPPPTPHHTTPQSQAQQAHQHPPSSTKKASRAGIRSLTAAHYKDARVHYADLKQQPHQHPQPPNGSLKQREEQKPNHTPPQDREDHDRSGELAADPSGPNSVLDPTPTNAGPG